MDWHTLCWFRDGMPAEIDRRRVQQLMADGAQVLEVLPSEEYAQEHLPGALSLPLEVLSRQTAEQLLQRDRPIVTYCQDDLCVVVNERRIVLGVLRGHALHAAPGSRAEDVMDAGPVTYRPNVLVAEMAKHFEQTGAKRVLVTTSDGELVGLLYHDDLHDGPVLASRASTEVHRHG